MQGKDIPSVHPVILVFSITVIIVYPVCKFKETYGIQISQVMF